MIVGVTMWLLAANCVIRAQIQYVQDDTTKQINFANATALLRQFWKTGDVSRIEVMHVPTNRMYSINVSSSMVDAICTFKLIVRDPKDSMFGRELVATINKVAAAKSEKLADLRWGCVFYTGKNEPVFAIYFDQTGRKGVVNGACVEFDSDVLQKWANSSCRKIFE